MLVARTCKNVKQNVALLVVVFKPKAVYITF